MYTVSLFNYFLTKLKTVRLNFILFRDREFLAGENCINLPSKAKERFFFGIIVEDDRSLCILPLNSVLCEILLIHTNSHKIKHNKK